MAGSPPSTPEPLRPGTPEVRPLSRNSSVASGFSRKTSTRSLRSTRSDGERLRVEPGDWNERHVAGEPLRVMVCVDGHDKTRHGSGDLLQWLLLHRPVPLARWEVQLFGHVHNDSCVPLAHSIGKALGATTDKPAREKSLRERAHALQEVLRADYPQLNCAVKVDSSKRKMLEVYPEAVREFAPHCIILNERTDADDLVAPFGTESYRLHHTLHANNTSIVVCKSRFASRYQEAGDPDPLTMHFIVAVDAELTPSSVKALECVRAMLPAGGGGAGCDANGLGPEEEEAEVATNGVAFVSVLSCWHMPDAATAMYSTDSRWHYEKKKVQSQAKRAAKAALQSLRLTHPGVDGTVHTSCESVSDAANKIIKIVNKAHVAAFHNVVIGGGRVIVNGNGERKASASSSGGLKHFLGLAKRRVFGSTADSVIAHTVGNGAVTVAY